MSFHRPTIHQRSAIFSWETLTGDELALSLHHKGYLYEKNKTQLIQNKTRIGAIFNFLFTRLVLVAKRDTLLFSRLVCVCLYEST